MKLEYLPDGSIDTPLIRFYDYDPTNPAEVILLREAIADLAEGRATELAVHDLPFIESIDDCKLFAIAEPVIRLTEEDVAVAASNELHCFTWIMSKKEWAGVIELLGPMVVPGDPNRHQWLTNDLGIEVLLSPTGQW